MRRFLIALLVLLLGASPALGQASHAYNAAIYKTPPGPPPVPLLDNPSLVAVATAAYSLRKLRSTYTGYAIRVTPDNVTFYDIGFTPNGDLDTTVLLFNCTVAVICTVRTWYDQSLAGGHDATQTTQALQPRISNLGVVDVKNNKPTVKFTGAGAAANDQRLVTGSFTAFSGATSPAPGSGYAWAVVAAVTTDAGFRTFGSKANGSTPAPFESQNTKIIIANGTGAATNVTLTTQIQTSAGFHTWIFSADATQVRCFLDGAVNCTTVAPTTYGDHGEGFVMGSRIDGATELNGVISESILFPAVLSAGDRSIVCTSQTAYYGLSSGSC